MPTHPAAASHLSRLGLSPPQANAGGDEKNEWVGPLIREHGWRASLVEPVPVLFEQLQTNYARWRDAGRVTLHRLAVHSK